MRSLPKLLLALAIMLFSALLLAAALALQGAPLVTERVEVAPPDIERALQLLRRHDPRRDPPGVVKAIAITQHDVDLLLNHGVRRWFVAASVRVTLQPYNARLEASSPLRWGPFGAWLNLDARLREAGGLLQVERLRIGRLPVPAWLAEVVVRRLGLRLGIDIDPQFARDLVQRVSLSQGAVTISYAWQADTRQRMLAALVPPAEQDRLKAYSDRLATLTARQPADGSASLVDLLTPIFQLAQQRTAAGADAAAENRAALVVLAFHANGRGLSSIVPAAGLWARPRWMRVTLRGREDFPQHYLVSAVLAAEGSSPLADAVGVYKEVADARGGSGFSFNDIAADRAGTRLGELSVQQPARLQAALAGALLESDLMPDVSDLPEFLPEPEFRRRFGGVGAPAYRQMLAEIDARIGATPLLR